MTAKPETLTFLEPTGVQPAQPLFVFLPGMDGTGALLETQLAGLLPSFDIRCLVLPRDTEHGWDDLAGAIAQRIKQELALSSYPNREVYLCGESFGGCLALKVALHCPDLIHRLILVNPASSFNQRIWTSWAVDIVRALPVSMYSLACSILMPFLANLSRVDAAEQQTLLAAMRSVGYHSAVHRVFLLRDFDLTDDDYQQIWQSTLIVASRDDRLLPSLSEAARLAGLMPHAKMHSLPQSGHACLLEPEVNLRDILQAWATKTLCDRPPALAKGDRTIQ
ncbi:MAG: alpha/beta hydrolase [Elainellaceae cyanobacterium]